MSMMMKPYFSNFDDFDPMDYMMDTFPLASSGFSRLPSVFGDYGMMPGMGRMMNWPQGMGFGNFGGMGMGGGRMGSNWPMTQMMDRGMSQVVNDKSQFAVSFGYICTASRDAL
jgi:hypothetical protein